MAKKPVGPDHELPQPPRPTHPIVSDPDLRPEHPIVDPDAPDLPEPTDEDEDDRDAGFRAH